MSKLFFILGISNYQNMQMTTLQQMWLETGTNQVRACKEVT